MNGGSSVANMAHLVAALGQRRSKGRRVGAEGGDLIAQQQAEILDFDEMTGSDHSVTPLAERQPNLMEHPNDVGLGALTRWEELRTRSGRRGGTGLAGPGRQQARLLIAGGVFSFNLRERLNREDPTERLAHLGLLLGIDVARQFGVPRHTVHDPEEGCIHQLGREAGSTNGKDAGQSPSVV